MFDARQQSLDDIVVKLGHRVQHNGQGQEHSGHYYECMIITRSLCHVTWSRKQHNLPTQTLV